MPPLAAGSKAESVADSFVLMKQWYPVKSADLLQTDVVMQPLASWEKKQKVLQTHLYG